MPSCPLWRHCNVAQNTSLTLRTNLNDKVIYLSKATKMQQNRRWKVWKVEQNWKMLQNTTNSAKYFSKIKTHKDSILQNVILWSIYGNRCHYRNIQSLRTGLCIELLENSHILTSLIIRMPTTWGRFNIKIPPYPYRKSHCGDKTILRPSYLHNGISYTGKMTSLYWIGALVCFHPLTANHKHPAPWGDNCCL